MKMEPYLPDDIQRQLIKGGEEMDELFFKMLKAAAQPLKNALSDKVGRHTRTGALAGSVKIGKPRHQPKYDAYIIDVMFKGKDKNKSDNRIKAKAIQYGWHHQTPDPFIQAAMDSSKQRVEEILQATYEQECSLTK